MHGLLLSRSPQTLLTHRKRTICHAELEMVRLADCEIDALEVHILLTCGPYRVIICCHKSIRLFSRGRVICKVAQSQRVSPLHRI